MCAGIPRTSQFHRYKKDCNPSITLHSVDSEELELMKKRRMSGKKEKSKQLEGIQDTIYE